MLIPDELGNHTIPRREVSNTHYNNDGQLFARRVLIQRIFNIQIWTHLTETCKCGGWGLKTPFFVSM